VPAEDQRGVREVLEEISAEAIRRHADWKRQSQP
jgi:hypothetical protein